MCKEEKEEAAIFSEKPYYCEQDEPGWCGEASIQMLIKKADPHSTVSQKTLSENIPMPERGTNHLEMFEVANQYFGTVAAKSNLNLKDLKVYLDCGYGIIANIWDGWATDDPTEAPEGHYLVVDGLDLKEEKIYILDPSRANRLNGKNKQYFIEFSEFLEHWYDFEEENQQRRVDHWALLVKFNSYKS